MVSKIKKHSESLIKKGLDPKLAQQVATVLANDDSGLPRTARGQRLIDSANKILKRKIK